MWETCSVQAQSPRQSECCAELGRKPSDGESANSPEQNYRSRSFRMQAGARRKLASRRQRSCNRSQPSVGRTQRDDDCKIITRIDFAFVARHITTVGPHCSRPAYPRHIAQALQLTRAPGRGLLAICLISTKPFVWSRHWNPGFRQPPGQLSRSAKRCLTPKGDEKCLAITRLTAPPSLTSSLVEVCASDVDDYGTPAEANLADKSETRPAWTYRRSFQIKRTPACRPIAHQSRLYTNRP